ncbi:MAG: HNH endonuclease [Calothrix sp. FI2-JRJ7]|nr:HNH endonuclease [Calothrix sp. FI2-JRJ7]OKH43171.1 HNH endonuclease [Calothrix sp. HK-06]
MAKQVHLYPSNWKELTIDIKNSAEWKCQKCGRICIKPGDTIPSDWSKSRRHAHKLQVHHWDRNPANNSVSNLAVLCAGCHLFYHNRRRGNISPGQLSLLELLEVNN